MTIDYDEALARESARFRAAVTAAEPTDRVPGCPDWDADDLLWHLTGVQRFWAWVVTHRPTDPVAYAEPDRPSGRAGLVAAYDTAVADLRAALLAAADDEPAWTWHPDRHTVGFIRRRQAHEALIHRVDAEQAAGTPTPLDPALAGDGVLEALEVIFAGAPDWGAFTGDGATVRVECTDTGQTFGVELGRFTGTRPDSGVVVDEDDIAMLASPPVDATVTVRGPAAELDTWLWQRGGDENLTVTGAPTAAARFRAVVAQPID